MMNYYNPSSLRQPSRLKKEIANSAAPWSGSISRLAKSSRISLFFIVMLMAMNHSVWAQNSANYTFATNATGSLALDMNGTAIDMSTGTTQLVGPGADATASAVTNIGFDFFLMGSRFAQFSVQDDGLMQLGGTAVGVDAYTISGGTAAAPRLSALNADFRTGTVTGKIHYKVVGAAPNRVLVVEFLNMQLFYTSTGVTGNSTWQIRLYERGNIEYVYGAVSAVDVGNTAANRVPSVGFYTGAVTGAFASILYAGNTVSVTSPYAANPTVTVVGAIANLNSSADGSRRVYQLIPPGNPGNALATVIPSPTFLSFSSVGPASMILNWAESSPNIDVLKYAIYRSADGGTTFTHTATVNVGTTNYTATGLTPSTSYTWRIIAVSEGGKSTNLDAVETTGPPGNYISVATGNWNSPATWDAGSVPNSYDNAVISAGNTVTIDATGLSITNLSVAGTLAYGTTPSSFAVNGNLTVAAGGIFNVFNGTTGKTLNVAGNIANNGVIDLSVGTTTAGNLTLNGTAVQTVNGSGTFNTGVIRNLVFSNTNTATPNINWLFNDVKVAYNLNITGARINLGTNKITFGAGAAGNTLTAPAGTGFLTGGKFSRWWTAAATGSAITAGADPTTTTSRYPFINTAGDSRAMYITRTNATGAAAGELAVVYNNAAGVTSGLSVADGAYTVTERYDGNWVVSNEGTPIASSSYTVVLFAQNAFSGLLNGNARVMFANAAIGGAHQNGTTTPGAQRITVSQTDLLSGPLYVGVASSDIPFISVANGNWNAAATWNKNAVPGATDTVTIANATTVTLNSTNAVAGVTVATGGTLAAASGALGFTSLTNSGTVNISGANLTASGTVANNSILNVTGGNLNVTAASTTGITNGASATLTVGGGTINLSAAGANNRTFANSGIMTVNSGAVNVFGNMVHNGGSTFNQSGGNITIDGNDAGNATNSVASGTHLLNITATAVSNLSLTGGTITIVDPPQSSSTSTYALRISQGGAYNSAGVGHTIKFGDGVSNDNSTTGSNGFYVYLFPGSFLYGLGNMTVDAGTIGTNRFVRAASTIPIKKDLTIASGDYQLGTTTHLGGNLVNNGFLTTGTGTTLNINDYNGAAVASTSAQSISGAGVFRNLATSPTANLTSLTVNNTNATGLTLDVPLSISGTLTLTNGKINTTNVNLLTLGTATASGTLSGGGVTAYINGPFARTIISGNSITTYQHFPVGKAAYAPIWLAPATTAVSNFKAEAFDSNTGTPDVSLLNLSATRRWETPLMSGTITDMNVRLGDASIVSTSIPVQGLTPAGVYTNSFGSVATYVAGTPNTTQSGTPITAANFTGYISYADSNACSGTPNPGNTIASSTSICAGAPVTLSLQNAVSGSGVTYKWQSSLTGPGGYTDIAGATNSTLSVVPTASTYYQCVVTCSAGPATATSVPVRVVFANEVTANTPNARCGAGTVQLEATPNSGATINWYAAATGGLPVATGNTFTTPSISATTTYYAASEVLSASPVTATLGAGATSSTTVAQSFFPASWGGTKTQYIIRASELIAAGFTGLTNLNSLGFEPANSGQAYQGFTVHIANTTATTAPTVTFISSGLTQVYAGTGTNGGFTPVANTVNTLAFGTGTGSSSTFTWDGSSNLVVSISWSSVPNASTALSTSIKVDNVGFVASAYRQRDNVTPAVMLAETSVNTADSFRPKFAINGLPICSSLRVPVIATINTPPAFTLSGNPTAICQGQSTAAVTITAGATDYDTYVWSPSMGVSGNATSGWIFNPTSTTNYVLTASQSGGSLCTTSANITVTVNSLPSPLVIPSPVSVCANAIVPLTVTGGSVASESVIGNATTLTAENSNVVPTAFCNRYDHYWSQMVFTAAELLAAGVQPGNINGIKFNIATLGSGTDVKDFKVYMGPTTLSTLTAFTTTGLSQVFDAPVYTHAIGVNSIVFNTAYVWDGTSNIIVDIRQTGADSSNNAQTYYTATTSNTVVHAVTSNLNAGGSNGFVATNPSPTATAFRLNTTFGWSKNGNVVWSPVTNLYTDNTATTPYAGENVSNVYFKSSTAGGPLAYTVTSTLSTGCSVSTNVNVTVNANITPNFAEIGTICQGSTAPTLAATSPNGITGTWSPAVVSNTASGSYVFTPAAGQCGTTQTLSVVVTSPTVPNFAPIGDICQGSLAPTFATTSPNGITGTWSPATISNTASGSYVFTPTVGQCATTQTLNVTVTVTPAPTGTSPQDFPAGSTLASFAVTGTGIIWYDANALGNVLPSTTPIVSGTTYYASQTVGGCESVQRVAILAGTMLNVGGFDNANFKYYPNPVNNILTVSYSEAITGLKLYNMVGQQLITKSVNSNETQIDMSHLPAGSYLLEVSAGNKSKMVKLLKNQ